VKAFFNSLAIWRLALTRLAFHCFITGGTAYTTSMSGVKWNSMDNDQKFMVLLGVSVIIASTVHAFLDRTIERIHQGKAPVEGGTEFIAKEKVKLP